MFVNSGVALGQAATPHAGELSVGEQRGGFTGYRLCRRPLQNSMTGWFDDTMSAGGLQAAGLAGRAAGQDANVDGSLAVAPIERLQTAARRPRFLQAGGLQAAGLGWAGWPGWIWEARLANMGSL